MRLGCGDASSESGNGSGCGDGSYGRDGTVSGCKSSSGMKR